MLGHSILYRAWHMLSAVGDLRRGIAYFGASKFLGGPVWLHARLLKRRGIGLPQAVTCTGEASRLMCRQNNDDDRCTDI